MTTDVAAERAACTGTRHVSVGSPRPHSASTAAESGSPRKASGKTNTEAKARLREILREHEDGVTRTAQRYSVEDAVRYWLTYGLAGVGPITVRNYTNIAERHVIPKLGARQLAKLAAQDVDGWVRERSLVLSTRTLRLAHSILNRVVKHAMARDHVRRNVVELCEIPAGRRAAGPSRSRWTRPTRCSPRPEVPTCTPTWCCRC